MTVPNFFGQATHAGDMEAALAAVDIGTEALMLSVAKVKMISTNSAYEKAEFLLKGISNTGSGSTLSKENLKNIAPVVSQSDSSYKP